MNLSDFSFLPFLSIIIFVMLLLQLLRKKYPVFKTVQLFVLLLFSWYYVYRFDWKYCISIILVTVFVYVIGLVIDNSIEKYRKVWLSIGIIILLGILCFFKYTNFFLNSFQRIIGNDSIVLNIILPIGISFYIFSSIAYLVDVYRKEYRAERNFMFVSLYIAFFPKLIAGPIVRGSLFFPQIKNYRGITWESFKSGIQIFVFGLFKKVVLADHLGVFVDDVFYAPTAFNTGTIFLAVLSYSMQIYFDFSGYSDMAIGISKILGFDFEPNFNLPYISQNESDFWRRWHISLSSWFRDYVYFPLGGSKKGNVHTYFNLFLVMLLSGLWHGAGWTFVLWGALHGIASCLNKAFGNKMKKLGPYVNGILTFIYVTLFWIVFRADDFSNMIKIITGMFSIHSGISQPYTWSFFAIIIMVISTIMAIVNSKKVGLKDRYGNLVINDYYPVMDLSKFWSLVIFFTLCGLTIIMGYFGNNAFIYGAF